MARIAFILLCHKDPEAIARQAEQLTAVGDYISIHFDARAPKDAYELIKTRLKDNPNVTYARKRIKCGWGEWSLVQASLYAVEAALDAFPRATHFYMVSGDCMAIKSATYAKEFLDRDDCDYIESVDFFDSGWIKTGLKTDRLIYRHWFNERTRKWWFYRSYQLQKRLGLTRKIPEDIEMKIGSQWWCLRRRTMEWVVDFSKTRKDVMRFFRTTWIPDETFFQTVVRHVVPRNEIRNRTLTFLMFTDYGMPVTFYNDHYDLLLSQNSLFARKISPEATLLKSRLGRLYASDQHEFQISNEGRPLFKFLTGRGRIGRRFATRFWENDSSVGRDRELLVIACKKWHVAKRMLRTIREETNLTCVDYLFDEENTPLPDLGGIEQKLGKRTRHRRALLKLLFDYHNTDRLVICLDPSRLELLDDFYADRSSTRLLEIECGMTEEYLLGHAQRVGLAGERTPAETLRQLMPTIRQDVNLESDRIRDREFDHFYRVKESNSLEENAESLAGFLLCPPERAEKIAQTPYLFVD